MAISQDSGLVPFKGDGGPLVMPVAFEDIPEVSGLDFCVFSAGHFRAAQLQPTKISSKK